MSVLGALTIRIVGDISQFNKDIASVQKQLNAQTRGLQTVAKSMTTIGDTLTKSVTLPIIGVGIVAVKMAMDFETSMRNVNSISKLSEDEFKAMGKSVIDMSKKFPQTAKELADGLYDIASSGFQGADGLKVLEASAKAASAGMTTTAVSAKGITAVLNAYGLEAEDAAAVSDTMFKIVDKGVITFEELSSTVGDWVGMAKAANLSFNEAGGAIAYMTTKGISAAEAGVSLQRMLTGIIKPSEEMATVIKNAGFESGEMMLKTLGLTGSMKVLNEATGGSITKLIELIPEIRGVRGANALLGAGYEDLTKFVGEFNDTLGSTDIALAEQSKALSFQLKLLKNSATAIGIELGNMIIPKLLAFVDNLIPKVDNLAKKFGDLSPAMQDNLIKLGLISAALPLFMSGLGRAVTGIIGFRNAMLTLNAAMIANPVTAAAAAFVLAGGAMVGYGIKAKGVLDAEREGAENLEKAMDSLSRRLSVGAMDLGDNTKAIDEHFAALNKLGQKYPEVADEIIKFTDIAVKDKLNTKEVAEGIERLFKKYQDLTGGMVEHYEALAAGTGKTIEAKMAAQDHENAVAALAAQYPNLTEAELDAVIAQDELKRATDEATSSIDTSNIKLGDYIQTIDGVKEVLHLLNNEIEIERGLLMNDLTPGFAIAGGEANKFKGNIDKVQSTVAGATGKIIAMQRAIDALKSKEITLSVVYKSFGDRTGIPGFFKEGGIVGYEQGGIIGNILSAFKDINIPKFDSGGMLAMLHPPEIVLNSKQAMQLLWNMANQPVGEASGHNQPVEIRNVIELDGQVIYDRSAKDLTDKITSNLAGKGMRG
jgi:TP901 family phage tail tape measure protein